MKTPLLKISEIVTTAGTQVRAKLDTDTVDQYAEAMANGDKFPPVVVFHDGTRYVLADGFHRVMAAARNGLGEIGVEIHKGAKSDALKFALTANSTHGLKRTNADKRRSVELALDEWPKVSDRKIAEICAVYHHLVAEVRKSQLGDSPSSNNTETRIGADGKERNMPKAKAPKAKPDTKPEPEERPHIKTATQEIEEEESESSVMSRMIDAGLSKLEEQDLLDSITNAIVRFQEAFPQSSDVLIADLETHLDRIRSQKAA